MAKKQKSTTKNTAPDNDSFKFPKFVSQLANNGPSVSSAHSYIPLPSLEVLATDQILTIPRFFNTKQCQELVASFEKDLHLVTTPLTKSKDYAARVNDRALTLDFETSRCLYNYLLHILTEQEHADELELPLTKHLIGLNPNLRIYRYRSELQQFFDKHYDESVSTLTLTQDNRQVKGKTRWTLLIYLTGGDTLVGGDTVFYPEVPGRDQLVRVHPELGLLLLHKHGDDCLLHELELVTKGVKWVLRSDLVYSG